MRTAGLSERVPYSVLSPAALITSMIGKVIGNYQVTSELAQGGMGTVYRGHHLNLPREVVIKSILLAGYQPHAQEHLKARFLREAYVQSQLDHPNIVRVYEFFTAAENYYLVMEYVDGMSLRDLLERQGALAPAQAVHLFKQALAAMDYAHHFSYVDESNRSYRGIVHRDIKPGNMLLDGKGRVKITDFGIVKVMGEHGMTQTGFNPGTVEYMSPEQIRGLELDARSDIYSLGVVLYEMLVGRLPFPPSSTGSDYEVRKGHIEMAPPPITELRPDVPAELAAIVMRSLAKDPAQRFQTTAEFLDAVLGYERNAVTEDRAVANPLQGMTGVAAAAPTVIDHPAAVTSATTSPKFTQTPPATPDAAPVRPQVVAEGHVSSPQPGATSRSRAPLMAVIAVIVVALAAAGAFLFTRQSDAQPAASNNPSTAPSVAPSPSVQPTIAVAPTSQPTAAANTVKTGSADLNLASTYERGELYKEAVEAYKKYLSAHPNAPDAGEVSNRLSRAQKIQGLLAIAKVELDNRDYRAARRDYSEVLMLNPESNLAKAGLSEAEAHLPRNAVPGAQRPMLRRLEEGLPPRPFRRNRPGPLPRREP